MVGSGAGLDGMGLARRTGKRPLPPEEDLAGPDEAFKMRPANPEGYITCQQTNRAFENPDSS